VHGLFVLGTTGEGASLSRELQLEVVRLSCQWTAERVPVLVGITDSACAESIRLAHAAAEAGAAAVVVAPPYYFRYSQSDLLYYLERLADEVTLPLVLYNMPQFTKIEYAVDTVRRASEIPSVIGLKDSSGDLGYLEQVVASVSHRPDFGVLIGPEEQLVNGLRAGACGGVNGGANLFPRLYVDAYEAARCGEWREAERLQKIIREVSAALYRIGDPESSYLRGLKAALSAAGICSDLPAIPFTRFTAEERETLEKGLENVRAAVGGEPTLIRALSS
jgi:2-dehydro-3-deoxy-D-pentonate aldolase